MSGDPALRAQQRDPERLIDLPSLEVDLARSLKPVARSAHAAVLLAICGRRDAKRAVRRSGQMRKNEADAIAGRFRCITRHGSV